MTAGPLTQPDPLIGSFVGSYRVERRLGEGGMGAVYELLHPGIGKRLALKLLHAEYAARPQIVQRFFDEARAVNVIGHPNIVDIMDFSELPDGRRYILMEYLEGDSLSDAIERSGPMASADVAKISLAICSALEAAHAAGIVHRDLKPENVHLVPRPDDPQYVKVLDFGIAKLSSELHMTPGAATRSGMVMGTPSYMSPEQAMGRTKEIDARTDVYALGIILYEMLVGRVPFSAESFGDLMLKHLQEPPRSLRESRPDVAAPWDQVIQVALAKRREERFQTMSEMAAAIRDAAEGRPMAARPPMVTAETASIGASAGRGGAAGGGTLSYEQAEHAPSPAMHAPQANSNHAGTDAPASGGTRVFLFGALSAIAIATAVIIVFIVKGSGGGTDATAAAPPAHDAGLAAEDVASAPPDAPPSPAPVPAPPVTNPDAAVPKPRPAPTHKKPRRPKPRKPVVKGTGTVRVVVQPWAIIRVNGKRYGQTPKTITLPAGRYRINISNSELSKSETKTIRIAPGKPQLLKRNWEGY